MTRTALLAGLLAWALGAGPAMAGTLTVTVSGVRNARGLVQVCLFATARDFPDCTGKTVAGRAHVPAQAGDVTATFSGLVDGVYAVSAYHDENGSGRLETNFLGIPREGVGASRDARGRFGPPSFDQAAFRLQGSGAITLRLVYP